MKRSPLRTLALALLLSCSAPILFAADQDDEKAEKALPKDFRVFTAKNGKSIKARVLARIDDTRYTVETPEGKRFTFNVDTLSKSDARYLDFWEPNAIPDLKTAKLNEVLEEMGYATLKLTSSNDRLFVNATIDGKEGLFVIDADHQWSTLDAAIATEIAMELGQGGFSFNDGKGGSTRSQKGPAKSFRVGTVELKSYDFEVIPLGKMIQNLPAKTIGAIGSALLTKLNALVDHEAQRLFIKVAE